MKKRVRLLCLLMALLVLIGIVNPVGAVDTPAEEGPVNYVVVVDISKSTEKSDEMRVCELAAQMFVDQLPVQDAQVGVVVFGHRNFAQQYSFKAYRPSAEIDKDIVKVRELVPLQPTADLADKDRIFTQVDKIDQLAAEARKQDPYGQSPQGLAVAAAVDMLLEADSAKGRACIVVVSDGVRKSEIATRGDFDDIESEASDIAKANNWPIFCLRLAGQGNHKPKELADAKEDMNETAIKTGAFVDQNDNNKIDDEEKGAFAVRDLEDVSKAIMQILAQYTDGETETVELDENGYAKVSYPIGELTSEASFSVSGAGLERVDISASNGALLCSITGNEETERYLAVLRRGPFQDYIGAKLICPDADEVTIEVYGRANASVDILRCSAKSVELAIDVFRKDAEKNEWVEVTGEDVLSKDDQIRFEAYFVYRDHRFKNCSIYTNVAPKLTIENMDTGAPLPDYAMSGDENGYFYEMSLRQLGNEDANYRAYAEVVSETLEDGMKRSGYAGFKTKDEIPSPIKNTIPEQTVEMNQNIVINLDDYISNPDGDTMALSTECTSNEKLSFKVEQPDGRTLVLNSGMVEGVHDLVFRLKDKAVEKPFELYLKMEVTRPEIKCEEESIRLVSDKFFPEILAPICGERILEKDITDAFYAEGLKLMITDCESEKDGIVTCAHESGSWIVSSTGKGKTVLNVTMNAGIQKEEDGIVEYVLDDEGNQAVFTESIEVEVVSRWKILIEKYGLLIGGVLLLVAVLLGWMIFRKKSKGLKDSWNVKISTQNKQIYETRKPVDLAEYSEKEITLTYLMEDQIEPLLDVLRRNDINSNAVRNAINYWKKQDSLDQVKLCATSKSGGFILKRDKGASSCTITYGDKQYTKPVQVDAMPLCIQFREGDYELKITMNRTAGEDNDY